MCFLLNWFGSLFSFVPLLWFGPTLWFWPPLWFGPLFWFGPPLWFGPLLWSRSLVFANRLHWWLFHFLLDIYGYLILRVLNSPIIFLTRCLNVIVIKLRSTIIIICIEL